MEIILKPIVTEKVTGLQDKCNRYGFKVVNSATKSQIKAAVEDLYGVKVLSVNTMRVDGKNKARYTKAGVIAGKMPSYKKALVTLKEGEAIDFYSNIK
ncbi:MAG: 50S ribosomal protein L23 [Bacteroidales bacterium]|nr:50S ribosomal protein L23 [Candidatus Scybalocola fimicaballi]MCQ2190997.1 50S ribosomal protein L23 [Paludibacteraceae bacterium]